MRIAVALRDRLPRVAALHAHGRLSARLVGQITWRTRLVQDPEVLALLDAAIAEKATRWEPLSDDRLTSALDGLIERYDPDAVIRAKDVVKGCDFRIGAHEDPDGLVTVWGKILGCDAAVLAARIAELLKGLCADDPRSISVRRSHAVGAIVRGQDHLPCRCGSPDCTASAAPAQGSSNVVISVLADPAALEAVRQLIAAEDREQQEKLAEKKAEEQAKARGKAESRPKAEPGPEPAESVGDQVETEPGTSEAGGNEDSAPTPATEREDEQATPEPEPAIESEPAAEATATAPASSNRGRCVRDSGMALLPGVKILPIVALAEAIRSGAAIKQLWLPGPDPEPHYRPSAKLAAFIRARDLFCRFPGCDVPAEQCDIDHVVPYPFGPTHASNLNCKCRTHHLGKTFAEGWHEEQLPDGTVAWSTRAGQHHTTVPGSRLFFPCWDITTAKLPPLAAPRPDPDRLAKMPKRRRTRAADQAARIKAEREHNAHERALEVEHAAAVEQARRAGLPPPAPPDYGNDPPPF